MRNKFAMMAAVILGLALLTVPALAHHGTATYDMARRITLNGTVTLFDWSNPHSQLHFDVVDEKGNVVHWNLECQPPSILTHAGWTRNSLKAGDKVAVTLSPARNGTPVGILSKVVLLDTGQELTQQEK